MEDQMGDRIKFVISPTYKMEYITIITQLLDQIGYFTYLQMEYIRVTNHLPTSYDIQVRKSQPRFSGL